MPEYGCPAVGGLPIPEYGAAVVDDDTVVVVCVAPSSVDWAYDAFTDPWSLLWEAVDDCGVFLKYLVKEKGPGIGYSKPRVKFSVNRIASI